MNSPNIRSLGPEDLPTPPRLVRVNNVGWFFRWSLLVVAVIGSGIALWHVPPAIDRSRRAESCSATQGYVLAKETVPPQGRYRRCIVHFSFRPDTDGAELFAVRPVPWHLYNQIEPGQLIPVVYHPDDAETEVWLFDNNEDREAGRRAARRLEIVIVAMIGLWGFAEFKMWRERGLARDGAVIWGRVVESGEQRGGKGGVSYWLRYEFQPPDAQRTYGRKVTVTKDFRENYGKPDGRLAVLYDPRWPRRNKPLWLLMSVEFVM